MKNGLLFINLGTPENTHPESIGRYLSEFLMDPLVIDIPFVFRWILVKLLIVPKRKFKSAEAYEKIWSAEGSPLLKNSVDLVNKLRETISQPCELGMRYGSPSIQSALEKLRASGVEEISIVPLYPQFALSSTESSEREVKRALLALNWQPKTKFLKDFFDRDEFVGPLAQKIQESVELSKIDKLVFSFHGLPARHVQKLSAPEVNCYSADSCCNRVTINNRYCYRAQCFATARKVAARLGLSEDRYVVTFQSRLGRAEWIKPYTDIEIPKLVQAGVKKIAVVCPSFVADCLETLEEIDIRAREDFTKAGGESFVYVPCLNSDPDWVDGLSKLSRI